ncbi:MAG: hypothetical protein ACKVKO_09330 [Acidimicrobiales bacterium]|jgi:hypothetical protein
MQLTIIDDEARTVEAEVDGEQILLDSAAFAVAAGWDVKPEGFCQGDVCIPYSATEAARVGDKIDLVATMTAFGRPVLSAIDDAVVALGQRSEVRYDAVVGGKAAPFSLRDLDGKMHQLADHAGKKKLLIAFASW